MESSRKKRAPDAPFIGRPRTGRAKLPPRTVRFREDDSQRVDHFLESRGLRFAPWTEQLVLDAVARHERRTAKN